MVVAARWRAGPQLVAPGDTRRPALDRSPRPASSPTRGPPAWQMSVTRVYTSERCVKLRCSTFFATYCLPSAWPLGSWTKSGHSATDLAGRRQLFGRSAKRGLGLGGNAAPNSGRGGSGRPAWQLPSNRPARRPYPARPAAVGGCPHMEAEPPRPQPRRAAAYCIFRRWSRPRQPTGRD